MLLDMIRNLLCAHVNKPVPIFIKYKSYHLCVCVLCTCTLLLAGSVWLVGVCRFRSLDILHKHGTREQARMRQIFAARNKNACEHPLVRTRVRTQRHMLALSLSLRFVCISRESSGGLEFVFVCCVRYNI